jgi:hypothetical protein
MLASCANADHRRMQRTREQAETPSSLDATGRDKKFQQ